MLYKLLEPTPKWLFNATAHGWVHPVIKDLQIHNDGTVPHLDINLSADYRLQFTPTNTANQSLELYAINALPAIIASKRITHVAFAVIDQIPQLNILMGSDVVRIGVRHPTSSLELPVTWRVNESHDGLWWSWYSRTFGTQHVSDVEPLL